MDNSTSYGREIGRQLNDQKRCLGALLGIAQGLLCDHVLSDKEIRFLNKWLRQNEAVCTNWPADILHKKIKVVLADGVITEAERSQLIHELQKLIGGDENSLSAARHVTEFAFDDDQTIIFPGMTFCLTGDFVYGPRKVCEDRVTSLQGVILPNVTKKLRYLIIGSLGSPEWKYGSFGLKVQKAVKYRRDGMPIRVIKEQVWAGCL